MVMMFRILRAAAMTVGVLTSALTFAFAAEALMVSPDHAVLRAVFRGGAGEVCAWLKCRECVGTEAASAGDKALVAKLQRKLLAKDRQLKNALKNKETVLALAKTCAEDRPRLLSLLVPFLGLE